MRVTLRVMEMEGDTKKWLAVATLALLGIVLGMSLQTGACFDEDCTALPDRPGG